MFNQNVLRKNIKKKRRRKTKKTKKKKKKECSDRMYVLQAEKKIFDSEGSQSLPARPSG
jgi:hypothetical protein